MSKVVGIDLAKKALRVAQIHALEAQTPNVEYRDISAEALAAEEPESFDVVTCMEMLEHVPDPSSVVRACGRLVKPGGRIVLAVVDEYDIQVEVSRVLEEARDGRLKVALAVVGDDDHTEVTHRRPPGSEGAARGGSDAGARDARSA